MQVERKKNLLQAKLLAAQTRQQGEALHAALPESLQKMLHDKELIVWQRLLEKYQYDDMAVVDFMLKGGSTRGCHDTPSCYPEKIEPASLTKEDLEVSAF